MAAYAARANQMPPKVAAAYQNAVAITPTDNTQIGPFPAFYVGGAGSVVVALANTGALVTLAAVPAGTLIPLAIQGVNATGTTATSIVGLG